MLKGGILNAKLLTVLGETGHTDLLMLSDAGMPIPMGKDRVDLAIIDDLPRQLTVLGAILDQLAVEKIFIAEEVKEVSPRYAAKVAEFLEANDQQIEVAYIPHNDLKAMTASETIRACIRTGERTSYSTMILQAGVPYHGDDET